MTSRASTSTSTFAPPWLRPALRGVRLLTFVIALCSAGSVWAQAEPGEDDDAWLEEDVDDTDESDADESDADEADDTEGAEDADGADDTDGAAAEDTDTGDAADGDDTAKPDDDERADTPDGTDPNVDNDTDTRPVPDEEAILDYLRQMTPRARAQLVDQAGGATAPAADAALSGALDAIEVGAWDDARNRLKSFAANYADDPRASFALRLADTIDQLRDASRARATGVAGEIADTDGGSLAGAIELVTSVTVYGIWTGLAFGFEFELGNGTPLTSALLGLAALGGSLWYAWERPVSSAQAAAASAGLTFGTWNGIAMAILADIDFDFESGGWIAAWGGTTLGLATGLILGMTLDPDAGDVALASSGGLWGTYLAAVIMLLTDAPQNDKGVIAGLLIGTDIGLAGMGVASIWIDTSRGRMALIDLGGLLGALLGSGIAVVAEVDSTQAAGGFLLGGAGLGIGLTAWLTSGLDDDDDPRAAYQLQLAGTSPIAIQTPDPTAPAMGAAINATW